MGDGSTVQFRSGTNPRTRTFVLLADAIAWGLGDGEPFDISDSSGAIVWLWEMR